MTSIRTTTRRRRDGRVRRRTASARVRRPGRQALHPSTRSTKGMQPARRLRPEPRLVWQSLAPTVPRTVLMVAVALLAVLVVLPLVIALADVPSR